MDTHLPPTVTYRDFSVDPPPQAAPADGAGDDPTGTALLPTIATARKPTPGAYLVYIHPVTDSFGRRFPVGSDPVVVGRNPDCGVTVPDASVSRTHARVEPLPGGGYQVTDLGSSNGTFVNNARVRAQPLRDGDYLQCGNSVFRFLAGGNVEAQYHEEIQRLASLDPLTGVHNRRALVEALEREATRAARHGRPLAVLLIDLDHFKSVNDRFGHMAGDFTLRAVAGRLRLAVRTEDLLGRYGGEEFAVVLPETDLRRAAACAERLRAVVAGAPFEYGGAAFPLTASIGAAALTEGETDPVTAVDLLQWADQKLYDAKRSGRNRVCA